jgi:prepilin-type processing-associated H-X9-DG protein
MADRSRLTRCDWVVVLICAAVALLSLGATGEQGRRRARQVVCQVNLGQWHDIFQGYIDPNGMFIRGDKWTPGYWWVKGLSDEHKDWRRTKIWFCPEAEKPFVDERGRIGPSNPVFRAWGIYTGSGLGPSGISGSYGLNGYVIPLAETSDTIPRPSAYETGVPAKDGWQNLREVPNSNAVPMFVDALRYDLWPIPTNAPAEYEFALWSGSSMARCCINRHDGAVNCLFVDGSVRKVGLKELWTLKWYQSFNTAGPWTKAGGALPMDWPAWIRPFKDY